MPTPSDPTPRDEEPQLAAALRARDRLRARAEWWERWRGVVILPLIVLGGLAGYGLGYAARARFGLPAKTEFYVGVVAVVVVGRLVAAFFDLRKLESAQHRVEFLRQRRSRPR